MNLLTPKSDQGSGVLRLLVAVTTVSVVMVVMVVVVISQGGTYQACTDDAYCGGPRIYRLYWSSFGIIGGHAAR